jgi:predicted ArsR family transcriptional regulator
VPVNEPGSATGQHAEPAARRQDIDRDIERVALLGDPARRALYTYVTRQADYVSRDQAAAAVGIARGLAAFHLDKLAADGLLEVAYKRPPGRAGPGAGRPAKLYRRSRSQVNVTLPQRDYEMLSRLIVRALDQQIPPAVSLKLREEGRNAGWVMADEARNLAGRRSNRRRLLQAAMEVLWRRGFEPRRQDGEIILGNCPFEAVARQHPHVVCEMNLAILEGFVGELHVRGTTARLAPADGRCCVIVQTGPPAEEGVA